MLKGVGGPTRKYRKNYAAVISTCGCSDLRREPDGERWLPEATKLNNHWWWRGRLLSTDPKKRFLDNQQLTSFRVCGPNAIS
jgi:hypothetical protein